MRGIGARSGPFFANDNLRGIALMIFARAVFSGSDSFTKLASGGLPASEVVTLRNAFALPVALLIAWRMGALARVREIFDRNVLSRSVLEGAGTLSMVAAFPFVTIGQSTVILLTVPLILVALSALLLREHVGWRRWAAIVAGFLGVIMVAGPLSGQMNSYLLLTQTTAVTWAFRDLITSRIAVRIPSALVMLATTAIVALMGLPGALWQQWHMFGGQEAFYLLGAAVFVAAANSLYIMALRTGAIAVVAPFRYTAALWATLMGYLIWHDVPDFWGVLGTLFIVGSGLYTFYREFAEMRRVRERASRMNTPP
jgi:drug/metabolite transporter (DMT)-like permease